MKIRRNEYEILNQMLDDAIAGTFEENCFDESELSKLQTKFMRYLSTASMSEKKIQEEREAVLAVAADHARAGSACSNAGYDVVDGNAAQALRVHSYLAPFFGAFILRR